MRKETHTARRSPLAARLLAASALAFASLSQQALAQYCYFPPHRGEAANPPAQDQQAAQLEWQGDTLVSVTIDGQKFRMSKSADGTKAIVTSAETVGPGPKRDRARGGNGIPPMNPLCNIGGGSQMIWMNVLEPVQVHIQRHNDIAYWQETLWPIMAQLPGGDLGGGGAPAPAPSPDPDKPQRCQAIKDQCIADAKQRQLGASEACARNTSPVASWWGPARAAATVYACILGTQKIRDNDLLTCGSNYGVCLQ